MRYNTGKEISLVRVTIVIFLTLCSSILNAQDEAAELAKKLANPIASLISVPFQNNADFGIGDLKGMRNTLNIQPVVPISLTPKLNLITRVIVPVITQYNISGVGESQSGVGDAVLSGFIGPSESKNGLTWGAGPVLLLPIGADGFTTDKFGIGPTAVVLKQTTSGWTFGALANQIWTIGESNTNQDLSQMFLQPFFAFNWKSGAGLGGNFEWTRNWTAETSVLWFNPVLSGVTSLGSQKIQLAVGPRFNLDAPGGAKADWGLRTVLIFLFPK